MAGSIPGACGGRTAAARRCCVSWPADSTSGDKQSSAGLRPLPAAPRRPSTGRLSAFQGAAEPAAGLSVSLPEPREPAASRTHPSRSLAPLPCLGNAARGRLGLEHLWLVAAGCLLMLLSVTSLQDHCYYHGHVKGYGGSWVVLSTCSGIRYGDVQGGGACGADEEMDASSYPIPLWKNFLLEQEVLHWADFSVTPSLPSFTQPQGWVEKGKTISLNPQNL